MFDSSIFLTKSIVFFSISLRRSSRSFVSEDVFVDVEPAGTWLERSQLLGSDLLSSRLVMVELLVVSFTVDSMRVGSLLVVSRRVESISVSTMFLVV